MSKEDTVGEINAILAKELWFDFHVMEYNGRDLIIGGGTDLTYTHTLELHFENVFYASTFFQEWHSNTKKPVLELPKEEELYFLNAKYEIEQGFYPFIIHVENYKENILVVAEQLSYNQDTVFYYYKEELKEQERLAKFVRKDKLQR